MAIPTNKSIKAVSYNGTNIPIYDAPPDLQDKSVTPSTSQQVVEADSEYDGLSSVTVAGDADLVAENIKDGVEIFGVTGTFDPTPTLQAKTVAPSVLQQVVTADSGYDALSSVTVAGDGDLTSDKIKSGVEIFGVTGTFTSDANATSADIVSGKSAYVNGNKISGSAKLGLPLSKYSAADMDAVATSDNYNVCCSFYGSSGGKYEPGDVYQVYERDSTYYLEHLRPVYRGYFVDLSVRGADYYVWNKNTSMNPDTDLYEGVYYSTNYGNASTYSIMRILFVGYTEFTVYIRSYAEGNYDYTIASTLDALAFPTEYNSEYAYESTRGNQQSGTSIDSYTEVTYECDTSIHYIYIVYRKDSGDDENDDKGYVLIPYPS